MKYNRLFRIGFGARGMVYMGKSLQTGETVAIKEIALKSDVKAQLEIFREISALRICRHENIVHLIEVLISDHSATLVTEFVESNLRLVIDDIERPSNNELIKNYFVQLFYGLAYLHRNGIMHRDIKPENILINTSNRVKIADFGLACLYFLDQPQRTYCHQVATRWYRAPELLFGAIHYGPAMDIWAAGCILAEFLNGAPLFPGANDIDQIACVFQVLGTPTDNTWPEWEQLPDSGKLVFDSIEPVQDWTTVVDVAQCGDESSECLSLLRSVLRLDPTKRASAEMCLQSDFLSRKLPKSPQSIDYTPPPIETSIKQKASNAHIQFRQQVNSSDHY
ncbi:protein kinase domain-containing protein [Ditylenchus destructor]|uniref:Protein kinase domain-containing protein n=1 Tax=Ditylenchus destructor TaxID=166010 RepID=A0AAD4N769_9BILA|nr:protein kinase domain-containing protein [Ditylenchus destructor]